jgi:hypothetical protein
MQFEFRVSLNKKIIIHEVIYFVFVSIEAYINYGAVFREKRLKDFPEAIKARVHRVIRVDRMPVSMP